MQIGYIGLGKMGLAQVERLAEKGWRVVAWNRSEGPRKEAAKSGVDARGTLAEVAARLPKPRLIWLMVPHKAVDGVLKELVPHLSRGDTVIDGGNSFYKDSMRRAKGLARRGIHFLDIGVSGGPSGAHHGACLMVGGDKKVFTKHERLFCDLSASYSPFSKGSTASSQEGFSPFPQESGHRSRDLKSPQGNPLYERGNILRLADSPPPLEKEEYKRGSYAYVGKTGAGHFVKMVHNGIEYGMMQSLAEGFAVLKKSHFKLNLKQVAELYDQRSVIESRLMGWLAKAFTEHGESLKDISGEVAQSGEGLWTVQTAKELGVPVKVIEDSLRFRIKSKNNPSYAGQVVSALRNQFGGHDTRKAGNSKS